MKLDEAIYELIGKQLPGIHADSLKRYIEQAEIDKVKLDTYTKEVAKLEDVVTELRAANLNLKKELTRVTNIETREAALKQKEQDLILNELKFDISKKLLEQAAAEAEKRASDAVTIATLLVKNPVVSEAFFEDKYRPSSSTIHKDGSITYDNSGNVTETREYKKEITKNL